MEAQKIAHTVPWRWHPTPHESRITNVTMRKPATTHRFEKSPSATLTKTVEARSFYAKGLKRARACVCGPSEIENPAARPDIGRGGRTFARVP